MKLYNSLTRKVEDFKPLKGEKVSIYSCGPTVYDHIHIGNLSAFIYADTLRRALKLSGFENVHHVMNLTDVDDKTIRQSQEKYPDLPAIEALQKLTNEYAEVFFNDMRAVGNEVEAYDFTKATDYIPQMQSLIRDLYEKGVAYIADDGIYFSIKKYKDSGKIYGQLVEITESSTSEARIQNDEYDKDSAHDFALWKKQKNGEPAWDFEIDGQDLKGRPGWHIECSAMSAAKLGQPFDIHTGGVDLKFPHHENEIAQSTAGKDDPVFAKYFVHNEHILVDGQKMSKSLNNFYTLQDIINKDYDPLAFRLLVLQSHYRNQAHFSWDNLEGAQSRLKGWQAFADLRWQLSESEIGLDWRPALENDFDTPSTLAAVDAYLDMSLDLRNQAPQKIMLEQVRDWLGINLLKPDISSEQKLIIKDREEARKSKDFAKSDELRTQLENQGIGLRDTEHGPIWYRL